MMGLTYEDIIKNIQTQKKLTEGEVEQKIKEKLNKLSGLISKEGAAHIVANELGINLIESIRKNGIKIGKLQASMRNATVFGKVLRVYDVRTFNKNGKEGKVGSFLIGDDTGVIRIVLWDVNHLQHLENQEIKEDVIIKVQDAYVRENQGFKELHLGNQGKLELNPKGITINAVAQPTQQVEATKKNISDLQPGDTNVKLLGTVVQVFEPRFYESCSECSKKIISGTCAEHGAVKGKWVPILNFFFDDGTSNIRAVAFREHAISLLGTDETTVQNMKEDITLFDIQKQTLLGKQYELVGRVTKNDMFDRIEFSVQQLQEADPEKIATEMTGNAPAQTP